MNNTLKGVVAVNKPGMSGVKFVDERLELFYRQTIKKDLRLPGVVDFRRISQLMLDELFGLLNNQSNEFDHGGIADKYGYYQRQEDYFLSRRLGYQQLIKLLMPDSGKFKKASVIFDILSGNGTFSRVFHKLRGDSSNLLPLILGQDPSKEFVFEALKTEQIVLPGTHKRSILKPNVADAVISAYGTHHIPVTDRQDFVRFACDLLQIGGRFVIQDFEPNTTTSKWYSEVIHQFRPGGHSHKHLSLCCYEKLLSGCFGQIETRFIYDPFTFTDPSCDNELELETRFYAYLINLFSLDKLLPGSCSAHSLFQYRCDEYWQRIRAIFSKYFILSQSELLSCTGVPGVDCTPFFSTNLTIRKIKGKLVLIAPRVANVGIGIK